MFQAASTPGVLSVMVLPSRRITVSDLDENQHDTAATNIPIVVKQELRTNSDNEQIEEDGGRTTSNSWVTVMIVVGRGQNARHFRRGASDLEAA